MTSLPHAPLIYSRPRTLLPHTHIRTPPHSSLIAHNPLRTTNTPPDTMGRELTKVVYKTDANEDFIVIVNPAEVRPSSRDRVRS